MSHDGLLSVVLSKARFVEVVLHCTNDVIGCLSLGCVRANPAENRFDEGPRQFQFKNRPKTGFYGVTVPFRIKFAFVSTPVGF
jgi:hypothetical protein